MTGSNLFYLIPSPMIQPPGNAGGFCCYYLVRGKVEIERFIF